MDNKISPNQPETDVKDIVAKLLNAGSKLVPGGSSLMEIMSIVVVTSLDKRKKQWLESIASGLIELQRKFQNFEFENLHENENFITAFMHASHTALKNHQSEKLLALRNAVLNTVSGNTPSEDLQLIFINYIDTMTQWHLKLLKFFHEPDKFISSNTMLTHMNKVEDILLVTFKDLKGMSSFYINIMRDLGSKGLINQFAVESGAITLLESQTTVMGKQFLEYINSPIH